MKKVHFIWGDKTRCGRNIDSVDTTEDPEQVTCRFCSWHM